jgi:hypothetical protein
METNSTQQEILLFTGTTFSAGQWADKDGAADAAPLNEKEKLAAACWNGLLLELLPEIYRQPANTEKLYLWHIREGISFLELDLGTAPTLIDGPSSIDPYLFLATQCNS